MLGWNEALRALISKKSNWEGVLADASAVPPELLDRLDSRSRNVTAMGVSLAS